MFTTDKCTRRANPTNGSHHPLLQIRYEILRDTYTTRDPNNEIFSKFTRVDTIWRENKDQSILIPPAIQIYTT